jgi:hypothetical protein
MGLGVWDQVIISKNASAHSRTFIGFSLFWGAQQKIGRLENKGFDM